LRARRAVYAAPVVLWALALVASVASPVELICGGAASCPTDPADPAWVTDAAYALWALAFLALVPAAVLAAYRGVRRLLELRRLPAVPPERHDVIR
jgi:hypothetical protein